MGFLSLYGEPPAEVLAQVRSLEPVRAVDLVRL